MTFGEFIKEMERANPQLFAADRIKISVASFKHQLRRAYAAGEQHHRCPDELCNTLFGKPRK